MSETAQAAPRLRIFRVVVFYLLAAPPIAALAALVAAPFAGGPFSPLDVLANPQRLLTELVYSYVLGAIPAGLTGATISVFAPRGINLPIASTVLATAFFFVMGYAAVKGGPSFAVIGAVAGAVCGAIVWRLRARFTA